MTLSARVNGFLTDIRGNDFFNDDNMKWRSLDQRVPPSVAEIVAAVQQVVVFVCHLKNEANLILCSGCSLKKVMVALPIYHTQRDFG